MMMQEWYDAARACGLRVNEEAGAVSGEREKIAFRLTVPDGAALEMSVNIPDKHLEKLREALAATWPGLTVARHNYGILIACPAPAGGWTAAGLTELLDRSAREAAGRVGVSHDNRYETYGEAFYVYLRGAGGALAGAVAGAIPWAVLRGGWFAIWLGALISIASFYGYRLCKGAHNTRFATTVIILFSVIALLGGALIGAMPGHADFGAFIEYLAGGGWLTILRNSGIGLAFGLLGLFSIRKHISNYTHEPQFLRRVKKPRDK